MIDGPWPLSPDGSRHLIPLDPPYLTPMFRGKRVALRVSAEDHAKLRRGAGVHGVITDLDTSERYTLRGIPCESPRCYCDAEIVLVNQ